VYTALVLQPGIAADTATARGIGLSANGQRAAASHFLLDGVENNNVLITGPQSVIPPEAVKEFRISTNNFSAEYGWTSGFLANAVTRSGTDQWHALAYFNLQNEFLNANDFSRNAEAQARAPFKQFQPGVQAGGPVLRARLYQFANVETLRSRGVDDARSYYLPTVEFLGTLGTYQASNQARKLLTRYAPPQIHTQPGQFDSNLALVTTAPPIELNRTTALERLDYRSGSGAHRLFARLAITRLERPDFVWSPYPEFSSTLNQDSTGVALGIVSTLTPAITNELRGAFTKDLLQFNRPHPEVPTLSVNGPNAPVALPGNDAAYSYRNHSRGFEFSDGMVWSRGRHLMKFGGGFQIRNLDGYLTFAKSGYYLFGPFALFTADLPALAYAGISRQALSQRAQAVSPNYDREYAVRQFQWFAQDTFRLAPRLTVNFGLRFERPGLPINTGPAKDALVELGAGSTFSDRLKGSHVSYPSGGDEPLYSARRINLAGRFGVSFSPSSSGATLLRAAIGMFHDRPFDNLWQNLRNNSVAYGVFHPDTAAYLDPVDQLLPTLGPPTPDDNSSRLTMYQSDIRSPLAVIFFTGVRHGIGNWSMEGNVLGARGRSLITTDILNRSYSLPTGSGAFDSRFQPALQQIYYRANQGSSDYAALSVSTSYRSRRAQLQASYTWSHSIDNQSEPLFGDYFDLRFSATPAPRSTFVRQFDSAADRGNSDFDQRHSLVFYGLWESPRGFRGPVSSALIRNWKVGALGAVRSGLPFTVTAAVPIGSSLLANRVNLVGAPGTDVPASGGRVTLRSDAFVPAGNTIGTLGRNSLAGPGFFNSDVSLSRSFELRWLGEAGRFTLRADAYNLLNHPNLGNPNARFGSAGFGVAKFGRQEVSNGFPALAPLRETARQVQLLVRIEF
jgi:hypothetical protein